MAVKNLNHPIRVFRQQNNLSLQELSQKIGICVTTLHHLEYNRGQLTARQVLDFCQRENVDPLIFFPKDDGLTTL